jgi:hypothetical protein
VQSTAEHQHPQAVLRVVGVPRQTRVKRQERSG